MLPSLDPIVRTVYNMMKYRGGTSILVVPTLGDYDPATSSASNIEESFEVKTIKFDYLQKRDGETSQTNSLIRDGDKQVWMQPDTFAPKPEAKKHSLIFNGVKHNIITVKEVNPSGCNPIIYELFIRE